MIIVIGFGLYFVLVGFATIHQHRFQFAPFGTLTDEAAVIAGHTNISTGIVIMLAALVSDPVALVGVAAVVFSAGVGVAAVRQRVPV